MAGRFGARIAAHHSDFHTQVKSNRHEDPSGHEPGSDANKIQAECSFGQTPFRGGLEGRIADQIGEISPRQAQSEIDPTFYIVPALPHGEDSQQPIVARVVSGHIASPAPDVGERVDAVILSSSARGSARWLPRISISAKLPDICRVTV